MEFDELTPEQMERAKNCRSAEELVSMAMAEGIDLSDDQLDAVAGGANWSGCDSYESEARDPHT